MANINLGKIRRLGFIKGLADSEVARQAAQAKIAEEDRAYQRLLKRDEETRAFQSAESEKGRAASAEQARIAAKAMATHRKQMYDLEVKKLTETQELRKTQKQERDDNINRNILNVMGRNAVVTRKQLNGAEILERYPDMKKLPNFSAILESWNSSAGQAAADKQEEVAKHWTGLYVKNNLNVNDAESSYEALKAVKAPILKGPDNTDISLDSWRRKLKNRQELKKSRTPTFTGQHLTLGSTIDGEKITGTVDIKTEAVRNSLKNSVGRNSAEYSLNYLKKIDNAIRDGYTSNGKIDTEKFDHRDIGPNNKETILDQYKKAFALMAEGFKADDGNIQPSKQAILKRAPFLKKLIDNNILDDSALESASLYRDRVENQTGRILKSNIGTDEQETISNIAIPLRKGISKLKDVRGNTAGQEETYLLADTERLPEGLSPREVERIKTLSGMFQKLELNDFKVATGEEGQETIKQLLLAISNSEDEVAADAPMILMRAVNAANPNIRYVADQDGRYVRKIKNRFRGESNEGQTAKLENEANRAISEGNEVQRLAKDIISLKERTLDSAGPAMTVARGALIGEELFFKALPRAATEIANFGKKIGVAIAGKVVRLADLREDGINSAINEEDGNQRVSVRRRIIEEAEARANAELQQISRDYEGEARINRERIVLKKIALTYRMSGLLQGDSSGRTISNADFEIASRALFGPDLGTVAKMQDIIKFFEYRNNTARMQLAFAREGTGMFQFANRVAEAQNTIASDKLRKTVEGQTPLISAETTQQQIDQVQDMATLFKTENLDRTSKRDYRNAVDRAATNTLNNPEMMIHVNTLRNNPNANPLRIPAFKSTIKGLQDTARTFARGVFNKEKARLRQLGRNEVADNFNKYRSSIETTIFYDLYTQYFEKLRQQQQ